MTTYGIRLEIPASDTMTVEHAKNLAGQMLRVLVAARGARPNNQPRYEHIPGNPSAIVARCEAQTVRAYRTPAEVIGNVAAK